MIQRIGTLLLVLAGVSLLSAALGCSQQPKADDVTARVDELESRVKELEKIITQTPAKETNKTTTESQLVGNWVVADEDLKTEGVITDLKLKADGTGKAVINHPDPQWNNVKYDVIGKQLQLREERGSTSFSVAVRLQSVGDTELFLEYKLGENLRHVRYARVK